MAKGGINLNPGADATLVAAATRAAMANVPKDLSETFESVAESYDNMMQSIGEAYGKAVKETVTLGKSVIKDAIADDQNITKGDFYAFTRDIDVPGPLTEEQQEGEPGWSVTPDPSDDPKTSIKKTQTTTIGDELRRIRNEMYKTGPLGIALTAEDKKKKYALQQEKDQLLSQLAVLDNAENFSNESLMNGTVDLKATGKLNLVAKKALTAYKTKSGIIQDGPYKGYKAVLGKDENDKLVFKLQDSKGAFVTGMDLDGELTTSGDEAYSIPVDDMSSILNKSISKEDLNAVTKIFRDEMTSRTDTYAGNILANKLAPHVESEDNLHALMYRGLGDNATSFADDLSTPSETSATIFSSLGEIKLKQMGAVDADNDGDIDKDDFLGDGKTAEQIEIATNNYKKIRQAILDKTNNTYDEETTRSLFLDYAKGVGEKMWQYSRKKENKKGPIKKIIKTPSFSFKPITPSESTLTNPNNENKTSNNAINAAIGKMVPNKDGIRGTIVLDQNTSLMWDPNRNTYVKREKGKDDVVIPNKDAAASIIFGNDYSRVNLAPWMDQIPNWDGSQFVTASDVTEQGGKTGIKIRLGRPDEEGTLQGGKGKYKANKDLDAMLGGNYYDPQTFKDLHDDLLAGDDWFTDLFGAGKAYDDVYIAKKFAKASDYFNFEDPGTEGKNRVKVQWKSTMGMGDKSKTFNVNDVSVHHFIEEMTAWMNEQMKAYGEWNLREITKKDKKDKSKIVNTEAI